MGCIEWLKVRTHPHDKDQTRTKVLVVTEIIRWMAFVVPIYLSVWRWTYYHNYPLYFTEDKKRGEFWGIVTMIFVSSSLMIYLPLKFYCVRFLGDARQRWGWRPSILQYIFLCACPCVTIILLAVELRDPDKFPDIDHMDTDSMLAIQMTVMGLTVTEWMAKLREEQLTYDLVSAMAVDFFFAYDVIDFFMMSYHDSEVFHSDWFYISYGLGVLAMFKYIPTQPTSIVCDEEKCTLVTVPKGAITCILVSMFCNDVPFVVVRLTTMIQYGFAVSDLIHPAKNIALIIFGSMQLYIIFKNHRSIQQRSKYEYAERRQSRYDPKERFINATRILIQEHRKQSLAGNTSETSMDNNIQLHQRTSNKTVYPPLPQ